MKPKTNFIFPLGLWISLSGVGGLTACSTTRDVMPGEDGINKVDLKASDDEDGRRQAIDEAKTYCKEKNLEAIFLDEKTDYTGSMDETTRKTIKNASNAAMMVGGMAQTNSWSHGEQNNDTGQILGGAGAVGHAMTNDKDYHTQLKFRCK